MNGARSGCIQEAISALCDRAEFLARIADAQAIINVRAYSRFDREAFEHAPRLGMISIEGRPEHVVNP
jgi:hypothetical protein